MSRFRVETKRAGARVDHLVATALAGLSVAAARRLVDAGAVRVDGQVARKGARLGAGQVVEVDDARVPAMTTEARRVQPDPSLPLVTLVIDDAFVAFDKPAGIPSHPLAMGERGTAANALVARFPECATAAPDPREGGLVHRLDTETSGVLVAARTAEGWASLRAALGDTACEKVYWAEVTGTAPPSGRSTDPIGRTGRRGEKVRVGGGRHPLPAETRWETLERRPATTLVRVRLSKGRPHQVRAHLAAAGFPIVGDVLYGAAPVDGGGLHLHAASVRFRHPTKGELILIEALPPVWAKMQQ